MNISAHNEDNSFVLPVPATYVVIENKEIAFAFVNPNWMERAEANEYLSGIEK